MYASGLIANVTNKHFLTKTLRQIPPRPPGSPPCLSPGGYLARHSSSSAPRKPPAVRDEPAQNGSSARKNTPRFLETEAQGGSPGPGTGQSRYRHQREPGTAPPPARPPSPCPGGVGEAPAAGIASSRLSPARPGSSRLVPSRLVPSRLGAGPVPAAPERARSRRAPSAASWPPPPPPSKDSADSRRRAESGSRRSAPCWRTWRGRGHREEGGVMQMRS